MLKNTNQLTIGFVTTVPRWLSWPPLAWAVAMPRQKNDFIHGYLATHHYGLKVSLGILTSTYTHRLYLDYGPYWW